MRERPFTRPAILAAIELLDERLSQASFNQLLLRLSMEETITLDTAVSVPKKAALLGQAVLKAMDKTIQTLDGAVTIPEATVREAVAVTDPSRETPRQAALVRGLALDGYVIDKGGGQGDRPFLRAALPREIDLPKTDDEVHQLLKRFGFTTPLGHLNQAIEAHTRGDWAAANAQARTFFESILDAIANHLRPEQASQLSSENRRALLSEIKFLSVERHEWTPDGKNFINGLFKMLHTDGSHPGLSTNDHCTLRLHLVLITARAFLRRLNGS